MSGIETGKVKIVKHRPIAMPT